MFLLTSAALLLSTTGFGGALARHARKLQTYTWTGGYQTIDGGVIDLVIFSPSSTGNGAIESTTEVGASASSKNGAGLYQSSSYGGVWGVTFSLEEGMGTPTFGSSDYYSLDEESNASASAYCTGSEPPGLYYGTSEAESYGDLSTSNEAGAPPPSSPPVDSAGPHTWVNNLNESFVQQEDLSWLALCPSNANIFLSANTSSGSYYPDGASASAYSWLTHELFSFEIDGWTP